MSAPKTTLSGKLSRIGGLSGKINPVPSDEPYLGTYRATPKAFEAQVLPTANKLLKDDIVIAEIPYSETDNKSDGLTVYIAKEV